MSVWKRVRQYSKDSVTSIIHGKAWHEETMATSSQARATAKATTWWCSPSAGNDYVCNYITTAAIKQSFFDKFKGAYSEGIF